MSIFPSFDEYLFWPLNPDGHLNKVVRKFSDIASYFQDEQAPERLARGEDPLLYEVYEYEQKNLRGDIKVALTCLYPGQIGQEYYMTKGHFHDPMDFAEVYVTHTGCGLLLLQDVDGKSEIVDMVPGRVNYITGGKAHRVINTGTEPLVFMGFYSALAGHSYHIHDNSWFNTVVLAENGIAVTRPNPKKSIRAVGA